MCLCNMRCCHLTNDSHAFSLIESCCLLHDCVFFWWICLAVYKIDSVCLWALLASAKSHMLSASRQQPHLLHVSAVDRRQTWSMDKSWRCVTLSGFLHSHIVHCQWNPISCGTHHSGRGLAENDSAVFSLVCVRACVCVCMQHAMSELVCVCMCVWHAMSERVCVCVCVCVCMCVWHAMSELVCLYVAGCSAAWWSHCLYTEGGLWASVCLSQS